MKDDIPERPEEFEPIKSDRVYKVKPGGGGWIDEHNDNRTFYEIASNYSLSLINSELIQNTWNGEKTISQVVNLALKCNDEWDKLDFIFKDSHKREKRAKSFLKAIVSAYNFSFSVELEGRTERKKRYKKAISAVDTLLECLSKGHDFDLPDIPELSKFYKSLSRMKGYVPLSNDFLDTMDALWPFETMDNQRLSYEYVLEKLRAGLIKSRDMPNTTFMSSTPIKLNEHKEYYFPQNKKLFAKQTLFCLYLDDWLGRYTGQDCYLINSIFASKLYSLKMKEDVVRKTLKRIKAT